MGGGAAVCGLRCGSAVGTGASPVGAGRVLVGTGRKANCCAAWEGVERKNALSGGEQLHRGPWSTASSGTRREVVAVTGADRIPIHAGPRGDAEEMDGIPQILPLTTLTTVCSWRVPPLGGQPGAGAAQSWMGRVVRERPLLRRVGALRLPYVWSGGEQ